MKLDKSIAQKKGKRVPIRFSKSVKKQNHYFFVGFYYKPILRII
ncbi:hypothetical protein J2X97_002250 [Epilithonimonas hungarica]|nr:hypothetical protein [Epilithonimonas hungarica]